MRIALRWLLSLVGPLGVGLWPEAALACAVCLSLAKDDLGFLWSALLLMAVPVGVAGLIGGWLYYAHAARRRAAGRDSRFPDLTLTKKESGQ